jgi:hypothetical protein
MISIAWIMRGVMICCICIDVASCMDVSSRMGYQPPIIRRL